MNGCWPPLLLPALPRRRRARLPAVLRHLRHPRGAGKKPATTVSPSPTWCSPHTLADCPTQAASPTLRRWPWPPLRDEAVIIFFNSANVAPVPHSFMRNITSTTTATSSRRTAWRMAQDSLHGPQSCRRSSAAFPPRKCLLGPRYFTKPPRFKPSTTTPPPPRATPSILRQRATTSPSGPDTMATSFGSSRGSTRPVAVLLRCHGPAFLLVALAFFALAGRKHDWPPYFGFHFSRFESGHTRMDEPVQEIIIGKGDDGRREKWREAGGRGGGGSFATRGTTQRPTKTAVSHRELQEATEEEKPVSGRVPVSGFSQYRRCRTSQSRSMFPSGGWRTKVISGPALIQ